jgi:Ca-activated chloride channel homolog
MDKNQHTPSLLTMFYFEWPWIFLLLPLPWLIKRIAPSAPTAADGTLFASFINVQALNQKKIQFFGVNLPFIFWGALFCWFLLVSAAARPQWLKESTILPETGRNLLLAVDVSGSMEIADLDQNNLTRLDVVKQVAGEFVQRREGDRIGLILFGTQAYLQTPLTFDRKTVSILLQDSVVGIAGRETAIGDAIGLAVKRVQETEGETVMVLLTDGANTAGNIQRGKAAELAAQQGLRIHTIGIGGEARTISGFFGPQMSNPAVDLDEETLKTIADVTGGNYFRATDRQSLTQIYQQLDTLEPVELGERMVRTVTALYHWPLGLGFIVSLILAMLLLREKSS